MFRYFAAFNCYQITRSFNAVNLVSVRQAWGARRHISNNSLNVAIAWKDDVVQSSLVLRSLVIGNFLAYIQL